MYRIYYEHASTIGKQLIKETTSLISALEIGLLWIETGLDVITITRFSKNEETKLYSAGLHNKKLLHDELMRQSPTSNWVRSANNRIMEKLINNMELTVTDLSLASIALSLGVLVKEEHKAQIDWRVQQEKPPERKTSRVMPEDTK